MRFIKGCSRLFLPDYVERERIESSQDRISKIARRMLPSTLFAVGDGYEDNGVNNAGKYAAPVVVGQASRASLGTVFSPWPTTPTGTFMDMGPWAGYQIKGRGSVPDHPITGIGMTALTANTTGTTGAYTAGLDNDGDCLIGTCDTTETCIINMGTFSSSQGTRTGGFYGISKIKMGADINNITALWPLQWASISNAIVADPANSARNIAGIVYRAGTDTNWQLYSASSADASGAYTDLGVAVSATTLYVCELYGDSAGLYARISTLAAIGSLVSYAGAKLPTVGTALVANAWGFLATGATRAVRWYGNGGYSR